MFMRMILKMLNVTAMAVAVMLCGCQLEDNAMEKKESTVVAAIMSRRSIRQYKDVPVERELLQKIAECGVMAPNALNKQEWEVRIVDDVNYLNEVTELMKVDMPFFVKSDVPNFRNGFRNASAIIAVACPDDPTGMTLVNVGLMGENMCLAAQDMGLGTCVMGGPAVFLTTNKKALEAKPFGSSQASGFGIHQRSSE